MHSMDIHMEMAMDIDIRKFQKHVVVHVRIIACADACTYVDSSTQSYTCIPMPSSTFKPFETLSPRPISPNPKPYTLEKSSSAPAARALTSTCMTGSRSC